MVFSRYKAASGNYGKFFVKVFQRCATFQVVPGFAHVPRQFARILDQRLRASAESLKDQSLHERVPNQMPGYCSLLRRFYQGS